MKKLLTMMIALVFAMGLIACGGDEGEKMKIKVWGVAEEKTLNEWAFPLFLEANPDIDAELEFTVLGEDKVRETYIKDPEAAADIFLFPNDQLEDLLAVDALLKLPKVYADKVAEENGAGSVDAAKSGADTYSFPATADNGYFLYYDKSFFTEDDVKSLETMVTKAEASEKQIEIDLNAGWYVSGFLFMVGDLAYNSDNTVTYTPDSIEKLNALGASLVSLAASSSLLVADPNNSPSEFANGKLKATVTGTWNSTAIKGVLGDNMGVAKLPTMKIDGVDTQISSFAGYKLMGVNRFSNIPNEALKYAQFLTNEASQIKRMELRQAGPSNIAAASSDIVKANPVLAALSAQNAYAVPQGAVPDATFWTPVSGFGADLASKEIDATNVVAKLAELVKIINREEE